MYFLESPDGTFSRPNWQPRQFTDPDWNTICVPDAHRPNGYTALPREAVRVEGDTVRFSLSGIPSVAGQRLASYPDAAELLRLLQAGHIVSPGPPEPRQALVAACLFWLLTDRPVGRDN